MKTVIEMAGKAFETPGTEPAFRNGFWTVTQEELERFAELVRADAIADEREAIENEWSMCVQSDLEHGVKSLNEQAAKDWFQNYREIAKFGAWLASRSNT